MAGGPASQQNADPAGQATDAGPLQLVELAFGAFPEITALNKRFLPHQRRLKLTLDVEPTACEPGRTPSTLIRDLEQICPSLERHACCGNNRIRETFFISERRPSCGMRQTDDALDTAHLLEHLIIDFQHFIADMRVCSGVTCGYRTPEHRYDIFIESPDERVSLLSVSLAMDLMNGILRGATADPLYAKIVRLARHIFRAPAAIVTAREARSALEGDEQYMSALLSLTELGYLREISASMNFSGVPLYSLSPMEDSS